MNKFAKNFFRVVTNFIFGSRRNTTKCVGDIARRTKNKKILEIGSGKPIHKKYPYSCRHLFSKDNDFVMSDLNPAFGHRVIDATKMNFKEKFDLILCLNVLEHVYDFRKAVENFYKALKKNGQVLVFVPYVYPLHDEPHDFFRYSEHALRKMFNKFRRVKIRNFGLRQLPTAYFLIAKK